MPRCRLVHTPITEVVTLFYKTIVNEFYLKHTLFIIGMHKRILNQAILQHTQNDTTFTTNRGTGLKIHKTS